MMPMQQPLEQYCVFGSGHGVVSLHVAWPLGHEPVQFGGGGG